MSTIVSSMVKNKATPSEKYIDENIGCPDCKSTEKCCQKGCIDKNACCDCKKTEKCCNGTCIAQTDCCVSCPENEYCCNGTCIAQTDCCVSCPENEKCCKTTCIAKERCCTQWDCQTGVKTGNLYCCDGVCKQATEQCEKKSCSNGKTWCMGSCIPKGNDCCSDCQNLPANYPYCCVKEGFGSCTSVHGNTACLLPPT